MLLEKTIDWQGMNQWMNKQIAQEYLIEEIMDWKLKTIESSPNSHLNHLVSIFKLCLKYYLHSSLEKCYFILRNFTA